MKYIKSIVPILVQNYYIFGGAKCCPKKVNEEGTEIDTSNNGGNKEETQEEKLRKHQEENLEKIKNIKKQVVKLKTENEIKEEIKNEKKITIEPPKGDKRYDEIIRKTQKELDEEEKKEEKTISTEHKTIKELNEEFTGNLMKGLDNIGATCYMNATLQCFANIKKFVEYFKYKNNDSFTNKNTLSYSFKEVIDNLWSKDSTKKSYAPRDFKDKISKMNPLFEGIAANDSKDLINFLIMTLHKELNRVKNPDNVVETNFLQNQANKFLMFKNFAEDFKKNNRSIISDLFYAMNCNITQCSNCNAMCYNYQTYFFLIFPLEEVRKHNINECQREFISNKINYFNNSCYYSQIKYQNANNNRVDIFDCFNYDCKTNIMSGQNEMYCNYCRRTAPSYMRTNLTYGPEILIIILNRGKGKEFNVKLNFSEYLDLTNYIDLKNTGTHYKLKGVITHLGTSDMGGHFIAFCKHPISDKWYQFNDATVTPVSDFKSEVIDYAMPYVLFYEKIGC